MNAVDNIVYNTIYNAAPLILCVLGGIYAYKANVLNIALEGMMLMGAFSSALFVMLTGSFVGGILISVLVTLILGLIFSFFSITKKGNCIITGLAVNLLVLAISAFALKALSLANINVTNIVDINKLKWTIPFLENVPILGSIFSGHTFITWLSFLMIFVMWVLMYKTKFGVYVRVVGENEEAAKAVGIKTNLIKYVAVLIGSVCCALAGANLSVDRMGIYTDNMTAGRGFIAIAAIYCGTGKPGLSSLYALVFGLATALANYFQLSAGSAATLFNMIPYIMIVIVLTLYSVAQMRNNKQRGF